jgi:hypothetical protein
LISVHFLLPCRRALIRPPPPEHERARLALQIEPEHDEPPRRRCACVSLPCALVSLGTLVVTA